MGAEFLSRTRATIRKQIDAQRVALATPGLFSIVPGERPRTSIATIRAGVAVKDGDSLIIEARKGSVNIRRGNAVVGTLDKPSVQVVKAIEQSGGIATGTVQRVHRLSGKADVTLC